MTSLMDKKEAEQLLKKYKGLKIKNGRLVLHDLLPGHSINYHANQRMTNKQKLKEALAIATLRKLLTLTHLVKEDIFIGENIFSGMGDEFGKLYLTKEGLVERSDNSERLLENPNPNSFIGRNSGYILKYHHLNKILQDLEGNERS